MGRCTTKRAECPSSDTARLKQKCAQEDDSFDFSETRCRAFALILKNTKLRRGLYSHANQVWNLGDYQSTKLYPASSRCLIELSFISYHGCIALPGNVPKLLGCHYHHMRSQNFWKKPMVACLSLSRSFASSLSQTRHSSSISALPVQMSAFADRTYFVLCHNFHATNNTTKYPTPKYEVMKPFVSHGANVSKPRVMMMQMPIAMPQ